MSGFVDWMREHVEEPIADAATYTPPWAPVRTRGLLGDGPILNPEFGDLTDIIGDIRGTVEDVSNPWKVVPRAIAASPEGSPLWLLGQAASIPLGILNGDLPGVTIMEPQTESRSDSPEKTAERIRSDFEVTLPGTTHPRILPVEQQQLFFGPTDGAVEFMLKLNRINPESDFGQQLMIAANEAAQRWRKEKWDEDGIPGVKERFEFLQDFIDEAKKLSEESEGESE